MGRLTEKVAVVTGAGSGIGRAIAERYHDEGASVVLGDISGLQDELAARLGKRAIGVRADVRTSADVASLLATAVREFGGLDIVCNNAGIDGEMRMLADVDDAAYERVMTINLRGVFYGIRHAIPLLRARGGGSIVNIASTAGLTATPGLGVYGASKAGVIALSRSAATEYAAERIRVNAICPAMIETPMVAHLMKTNPEDAARVLAVTPMGRVGQTREVADVALFLASDESSYVTGVALPVDGAYTAI